MNTLSYIWECTVNFLELLLFFLFIHTKLQPNTEIKHHFLKQSAYLLLEFALICVLNDAGVSSMLTVTVFGFFDILFAVLFYQSPLVMRIFWGCMYSVICLIAESITVFVPQTFSGVMAPELLSGGVLRMPFTLLYIALIAVFVFLSHSIGNNRIFLSPLQKISYLSISVTGIMIAHYILLVTLDSIDLFHSRGFTFRLILINLFFILLFLTLLLYSYQLGYSKEQNLRLLEKEKERELEEQEYKNLLKTTLALREMKHDIEIHLDVIQTLAEKENTDDLLSYLETYHHSLNRTHHLISTGNPAIDCVLSAKIDHAKKNGVKTDYSVLAPQDFPLDALSLSSLLGNLWNNAIEACQRFHQKDSSAGQFIRFYIRPFRNMVLIHMENSFDGTVERRFDYSFRSLKTGTEHGLGMKRIHDIVKDAGGMLEINTENHIFTVHIILPRKEQCHENEDSGS